MMPEKGRVRETGSAPVVVRTKRRIVIGSVFAVIVVFAASCIWSWTIPALTIRQVSTGQVIFQIPLSTNEHFSLSYIHSIHLTPVVERFYMNEKRQIVLNAVVFESYGVGMPTALERNETLRMEDGKLHIENIQRPMDSFDLRIGQVIADHKLHVRHQVIPLSRIGEPGSAVRFEIDKQPVWMLYMKGVLHDDK